MRLTNDNDKTRLIQLVYIFGILHSSYISLIIYNSFKFHKILLHHKLKVDVGFTFFKLNSTAWILKG